MATLVTATTNLTTRPRAVQRPAAVEGGTNSRFGRPQSNVSQSPLDGHKEPERQPDGRVPILNLPPVPAKESEASTRETRAPEKTPELRDPPVRRGRGPYDEEREVKRRVDMFV